jgi:hypothetical protein
MIGALQPGTPDRPITTRMNMAEGKRIELSTSRLATDFKSGCDHSRYLPMSRLSEITFFG